MDYSNYRISYVSEKSYHCGRLIVIVGFIVTLLVISRQAHCILSNMDGYFDLPASTRRIAQQSTELSRSCTHWMKFDIAPADLDAFISTTLIKEKLSSISLPNSIGGILFLQQETRWKLHSVDSYLSGEAEGTGKKYLDEQFVFADTTNPRLFTVDLVTKNNWI